VASQDVPKENSSYKPRNLEELGGTVLAAIGGGLGILGFVAFFGAAILWVRMDKVGLPGNDAVAVVPKPVLVSTGASFLVPALLIAIGFTLLLYLIDTIAVLVSERPVRRLEKWIREVSEEAEELREEAEEQAAVADAACARLGGSPGPAAGAVPPGPVDVQAENELRATVERATAANGEATEAERSAVEVKAMLERTMAERKRKTKLWRNLILIGGTVALFAALTVVVIQEYEIHGSSHRTVILILVPLALITLCVAVRLRTESFGWFAVAAFVAVALMVGTLTYYRTVDDPKMEPAALLRSHGSPVYGFYVTQTSDRVYLATTPRAGRVRLDSVPREEILELLVGKLQRPEAAEARALAFAHRLCLNARRRKVTGRVAGRTKGGKTAEEISDGCTAGDLRRLELAADR
jgi:hypothetical protein